MSTSKNRQTPVDYMGPGKNVLWRLHAEPPSDNAFHRGADISLLSQFVGEKEVLFPPCTMRAPTGSSKPAPLAHAVAPHTPSLKGRAFESHSRRWSATCPC